MAANRRLAVQNKAGPSARSNYIAGGGLGANLVPRWRVGLVLTGNTVF